MSASLSSDLKKKKKSSDFTLIWQYSSCKYCENQSHSDDPFRWKDRASRGDAEREHEEVGASAV